MDILLSLVLLLLPFIAVLRRVIRSIGTSLLAFLNGSGSSSTLKVDGGDVCKEESPNERCKLSEDCVYEILSRVDACTLSSCLLICRRWRRLAYEPTFQALHSLRNKMTAGFLLGTSRGSKINYSFLSTDAQTSPFSVTSLLPMSSDAMTFKILATCPAQCLLLCMETVHQPRSTCNENQSGYVCNYYLTRLGDSHHRRIPNPRVQNLDYFTCIFGIDAYGFKIVRINAPKWKRIRKPRKCICEIFDSAIGKWRFSTQLPYIYGMVKNAVVVKQAAYWLVLESGHPPQILSFDIEKERGGFVPVPAMTNTSSCWTWEWRLVACVDKLCLMHFSYEEVKFWAMVEEKGECCGWEWKGLVSVRHLMDHKFAFEEGIEDDQVVLLETLYRELWYKFNGYKYIDWIQHPRHVWRLCMDLADLKTTL